jgi:predicted Zn-dependent peptidase
MGGPALPRSDPNYAALKLAKIVFCGYFASRLVANIREDKGYTYLPQCVIQHAAAGSTLQLEVDVASEVTAPSLLEISYELGRMATLPVAADELENARQYAIGMLALAISTQGDLADKLVALDTSGLSPDWLQEHSRHLAEVTVEQVLEQAARFLAPARLVTVVLGDANLVEPSMRTLSEVTYA